MGSQSASLSHWRDWLSPRPSIFSQAPAQKGAELLSWTNDPFPTKRFIWSNRNIESHLPTLATINPLGCLVYPPMCQGLGCTSTPLHRKLTCCPLVPQRKNVGVKCWSWTKEHLVWLNTTQIVVSWLCIVPVDVQDLPHWPLSLSCHQGEGGAGTLFRLLRTSPHLFSINVHFCAQAWWNLSPRSCSDSAVHIVDCSSLAMSPFSSLCLIV